MAEYVGPHLIPEGDDPNNVPGDLAALAETIIPAMTTAEIAALPWDRKPAGRFIVWNTTKLRLQRSTGAAMVDVLDTLGGTLTADLSMQGTSADNYRGVWFKDTSGVNRWFVAWEKSTGKLTVNRYNSSGVWQSAPLAIESSGHVASASHVGGVWSGTLDASGRAAIALPTSPTGAWSVTANAYAGTTLARLCHVYSTTASAATVVVSREMDIGGGEYALQPCSGESAAVHWHAIAY